MTPIETANTKSVSAKEWPLARPDLLVTLAFLLTALIGFSLIGPAGEFPLNDDWAFLLPVKWLVEQGRLHFTDWQFMTLIGQVVVGAAVSQVTGFSITTLRCLVIGLGVVSVLLAYGTARAAKASPLASFLAASLLFCNPIFVLTTSSFMTDIPFVAACLAAIFLRLTAQRSRGPWRLVAAWFFVVVACSIRQSGIAVALGFIAFDYVRRGSAARALRDSVLPALVVGGLLAVYPKIVQQTIGLPSMFDQPNQEVRSFLFGLVHLHFGLLVMALKNLIVVLGYLGFCIAPLFPLVTKPGSNWRRPAVGLGIAALVTLALIACGRTVPVPGNTFFDFGLGVRTLPSAEPVTTAPALFWWAIAFLTGVGVSSVAFAAALVRWPRSAARPSAGADRKAFIAMLLTIILVYNIPFLMRGGIWFDRYCILNIALFGCLFAPYLDTSQWKQANVVTSAMLLVVFFAFGVAGTHDYLEWNRQRWLAASELASQQGVTSAQIDGGFEYNNYQGRLNGDQHRPPESVNLKNEAAVYRLAFSPLPHHTVISVRPCRTWLYGSPRRIFVLRVDASRSS